MLFFKPKYLRAYFAEFLGTFLLVLFGCGAASLATSPIHINPLAVAFSFGIIVCVCIYSFSPISGAHINPAVTIAFAAVKLFPKNHVFPYILSQCLGAFAASLSLQQFFPKTFSSSLTLPNNLHWLKAFTLEFLLSFFLMFIILSIATDSKNEKSFAGLVIGFFIFLCALVFGPLTGASLNPARSFGPALATLNLNFIWLYLIAPCLGTILGAFFYEFLKKGKIPAIVKDVYGTAGKFDETQK